MGYAPDALGSSSAARRVAGHFALLLALRPGVLGSRLVPKQPAKRSAKRQAQPKPSAAPKPPRVGRPKGKPSAQTRAAILLSAREQFMRVGYERATNREIAAEAGVTAAAIYQYFESKTELYVAVAAETMQALMPRLHAAARGAPSARAGLCAIVREQLSIEQHVSASRFLAGVPIEMQRHPEIARAMVAQPGTVFELVLEIIRRGVKSGEIAREKSERLLAVYFAGLIGLSIHGTVIGGSHSEAAVQGFIDLLEGTLFP